MDEEEAKMKLSTFSSYMILVTVTMMGLLHGAEVDIFVPSFPELQQLFDLSAFWLEGLISVNIAASVFALLFIGHLADKLGYKPIIMLGTFIFIIGSFCCLQAYSYYYLIIGRILQGIGIAAPSTLYFVIISENYSMKQQQSLSGIMNGVINAAVATAPVVGSYVTIYYKWKGNFTVLLTCGIAVLIMTYLFIPLKKAKPEQQDPIRIPYKMIFSKPLMLLITNILLICLPYWIFLSMSSLIYVDALGVSLALYGFYQGTWALVFSLGSVIVGMVVHKFHPRSLVIASILATVAGFIAVFLVTIADCKNPLLIACSFTIYTIAEIIPATILYPLMLNYVPAAKGRIASLITILRLVFTAICIQIAGYFFNNSFQNVGIIISIIIVLVIITSIMILKNTEIMRRMNENLMHS